MDELLLRQLIGLAEVTDKFSSSILPISPQFDVAKEGVHTAEAKS